jgi:hypothetical protein
MYRNSLKPIFKDCSMTIGNRKVTKYLIYKNRKSVMHYFNGFFECLKIIPHAILNIFQLYMLLKNSRGARTYSSAKKQEKDVIVLEKT